MAATTDTTALRLRLLSIGYTPLPAHGKQIYLIGWASLAPTPDDITSWKRHPDWSNTGIATRHTPAIDIDITDPVIATIIDNLAFDHFGRTGMILRRVGRAPKRAILFQTPEPFAKRLAVFDAPAAPRIEILASGQQLICYGIHPDTKRSYLWEPAGPMQVARQQLPVITAKTADQFLADAVRLLKRQCGWSTHKKPTKPISSSPSSVSLHCGQFNVEAVRGIL
jgi:Bifunctional DNA primase/polymerase, N-terminal